MNKKMNNFTKFYLLFGIILLIVISIINSLLPEVILQAISSKLNGIVFIIYILLFIVVKIYEDIYKIKNNIEKNNVIGKYIVLSSVLIFIGLIFFYHHTGPRGATNNCYDDFKFVSCEKQTKTSIYGNTIYTCLRDGKKSLVNCKDDDCKAVCER